MQPYMKPGVSAAFAVVIVPAFLSTSMRVNGQDDVSEEAKFRRGLEIAPVPVGPAKPADIPRMEIHIYLRLPAGRPAEKSWWIPQTILGEDGISERFPPTLTEVACLPHLTALDYRSCPGRRPRI